MRRARIAGGALLAAALLATPAVAAPPPADARGWLGEEMPLPLAVKTPQDLAVKAVAEKQYLVFNLLAGGKLAWDAGDFATAATKWEALLRVPALDPEIDRVMRPLAIEARERAGGKPGVAAPEPGAAPAAGTPTSAQAPAAGLGLPGTHERAYPVSVSGTVAGGGATGPGGAVIWLKRATGETPRPAPARGKIISQK